MYGLHRFRAKGRHGSEPWSLAGHWKEFIASVLRQFLASFSVLSSCVESRREGRLFAETDKNKGFATNYDSRLLWTTPQNPTHNRLVAGSNPAGPTTRSRSFVFQQSFLEEIKNVRRSGILGQNGLTLGETRL